MIFGIKKYGKSLTDEEKDEYTDYSDRIGRALDELDNVIDNLNPRII